MAILKHCAEAGTRVEFSFIYHIPGYYEGCQMNFRYFKADQLLYDLDFGWTNITLTSYINVTSNFPLDRLERIELEGLYVSFEKHLYQLEWAEVETDSGMYKLRFFGSDQDFQLVSDVESVRKFGRDLASDWADAPVR
ncbi:hypothetical protein JCM10914A_25700 [Paenibacillus sp. JCM 10914]